VVRAVFLDRDGVINENRDDHVKDWSEFRFLPGAAGAVARLSQAGLLVFVITNQAIINRGLVSRHTVDAINQKMTRAIEQLGGRIQSVVYCPHRPDEGCACRKPRPGLLLEIANRYCLNLREAVLIGDALTDIEAGRAVGCESILVLTGRGPEQLALATASGKSGFTVARDLSSAVDLLLSQRKLEYEVIKAIS
jgi:D-glycero-D-manno-heptose 1,7-bisphosphate phosphatase